MEGKKNYTDADLDYLQNNPSQQADDIGSRMPYHLQYVRDGKVNVKPEENGCG